MEQLAAPHRPFGSLADIAAIHSRAFARFQRRWPEISLFVVPELVEVMLAVKPRGTFFLAHQKWFNAVFSLLFIAVCVLYAAPIFLSFGGSGRGGVAAVRNPLIGILFWLMLFGSIFLGRQKRRTSGLFSFARLFSHGSGCVVPDIWLTGLSYPQILATEAAVAFLRKPPIWQRVLSQTALVSFIAFILWKAGVALHVWLLVALGVAIFSILSDASAPILRSLTAAKDLHYQVLNSPIKGTLFAAGMPLDRACIATLLLMGLVPLALMAIFINLGFGKSTFLLYLILIFLEVPLIWRVLLPRQLAWIFRESWKNGQEQFQMLSERSALRS